jgi:hypothetical protein
MRLVKTGRDANDTRNMDRYVTPRRYPDPNIGSGLFKKLLILLCEIDMATLPGIEPGLPSRKADAQKPLYYQHNQTRLTWGDFTTILALYGKHTSKTPLTLLARFISRPGWSLEIVLHKMRRSHQGDVRRTRI